ncbi:hypothetical protein K437DRAFT_155990 [Tilletiaria anomala UBC 951]|uniref:Uncharacterized protein n=1 Tax=Tilletiaria anomala (strain ATCC 24038 / CBS 436.72 / UBC 951) TaxID=1037660 RepID=A0A066VMN3_TILAU|nr:uncharacterized protein K437DRAFT_155990 [Tilletiaria anomala UBC 951]KDN43002.1 hypothetical protein K437DRAFT_155990 [Tilletiaria anomala UBC 951]
MGKGRCADRDSALSSSLLCPSDRALMDELGESRTASLRFGVQTGQLVATSSILHPNQHPKRMRRCEG